MPFDQIRVYIKSRYYSLTEGEKVRNKIQSQGYQRFTYLQTFQNVSTTEFISALDTKYLQLQVEPKKFLQQFCSGVGGVYISVLILINFFFPGNI